MNSVTETRLDPKFENYLLQENPRDAKILQVWNQFFLTHKNIPFCEFVQFEWNFHKYIGTNEPLQRVALVYNSLISKAMPPEQRVDSLVPQQLYRTLINMHCNGANADLIQLTKYIYSKIFDQNVSDQEDISNQKLLAKHLELGLLAEQSYQALLKPDIPNRKNIFINFLLQLLKTIFCARLSEIERIIDKTLKDQLLLDSSKDHLMNDSIPMHEQFTHIASILIHLDRTIKKRTESIILENIKKRLEETVLSPFEGTAQEWITHLKMNFSKLAEIKYLDLSNLSLPGLPNQFISLPFTGLLRVNLSHNSLRSLPERFFPWSKQIIEVRITDNKIQELPENLLSHCNLQSFACDSNLISKIGPNLGRNWTKLQRFSAWNNVIIDIAPDFGKAWTECKEIDLDDNQFSGDKDKYHAVMMILQKNLAHAKHKTLNLNHPIFDSPPTPNGNDESIDLT